MSKDETVLDEIIQGRVEPYIYAFSTNTFPNYLKVGDTYRSVTERLNEWKRYYPNLKKEFEETAKINEDLFFRDHSIHKFLVDEKHKARLLAINVPEGIYFSNEFFENTHVDEVEEAIEDIKHSYEIKENKYLLYNVKDASPDNFTYARVETYKPRPNQSITIENFKKAVKKGRTNLLMYAVMRFGKSFTSMCCAKEIKSKLVVVVSAKADVRLEWKKTVESHVDFAEYVFLTNDDLKRNNKIVTNTLKSNKVVVFLTLQDLQGDVLKDKHKEIFKRKIDLLIIDETHFGARAEQYGKALLPVDDIKAMKHKNDSDDFVEANEADEQIKVLDAKVRLHLSGTPYRILMGSEFTKDDIIAFYQFSNIVDDQEEWNNKYLLNDDYQEWDNPYYGFPQMIRFAFNPNESSLRKMEQMKNSGVTYALSELFRPVSIIKDSVNNMHKKFKNEDEVLDLLKIIDGSKDDSNILGFLDYEKIKEGNMCRHIVIVLPYCASCDALEYLINEHKDEFLNLKEYEIINISGVDNQNLYRSTKDIKNKIKECENNSIKTITLTVNRMLTGSTVEYWDTMIYLKNTASPQEYDQAIFRLQNQYIKTYENENGDVIKYNMKPQTLLVDFDPARLFIMQEQKAQIYNVNVDESGNSKLEERLRRELEISPIITLNHNKMVKITPTDILQEISNYSKNKGVVDEASTLPVDLGLMQYEDILKEINAQGKLGSKEGLSIKPAEGEGDNIDTPDQDDRENNTDENPNQPNTSPVEEKEDAYKDFKERFKMYYARILFFAFLTDDEVKSVDDIISIIDKKDNKRISKNLSLDKSILKTIRKYINKFYLSQLDYKIQNLNNLSKDTTLTPLERAKNAISKFDRLSNSEVITPDKICEEMIDLVPLDILKGGKILDIASKSAEFALAIYCKLMNVIDFDVLKNLVYSIPTSAHAYEFTRNIYKTLGLSVKNIAQKFNTYDLLKIRDSRNNIDYLTIEKLLNNDKHLDLSCIDKIKRGECKMKFNVIVGNPPYQEETIQSSSKNGQKPRKNIFHFFQILAESIAVNQTVLIYPGARWIHQSGKGLRQFGLDMINNQKLDTLIFYPSTKEIFETIDIPDGVSIVSVNKQKVGNKFKYIYKKGFITDSIELENPGNELIALNPKDTIIVEKIKRYVEDNNLSYLSESVLPRSLFGIESDFIESNLDKVTLLEADSIINYDIQVKLLANDKAGPAGRSKWFIIDKGLITNGVEHISKWQVVVSSAHPGGQEGRDNQIEIIDDHSCFGRSRVALKSFVSKKEAENFVKYCTSKLIKFAFLMTDESLSSLAKAVPDLLDYSDNLYINFDNDIDSQLYQLFNISESEIQYIESIIK